MYAIVESCGRQYKVSEGDTIFFEKLDAKEGEKITFDNVVLVSDDKDVKIGTPYVKGAKVEGTVISHGKGKKVVIKKQQHNSCNRFLLDLKIHDWSDIKKTENTLQL